MDLLQIFPKKKGKIIDSEYVHKYLKKNRLAILSTVNEWNQADAAPIFYVCEDNFDLLFVTPVHTKKKINIDMTGNVVLTVADEESRQTLQIRWKASEDKKYSITKVLEKLSSKLTKDNNFVIELPLLQYKDQKKVVVRVQPKEIRMRRYTHDGLDEQIFQVKH